MAERQVSPNARRSSRVASGASSSRNSNASGNKYASTTDAHGFPTPAPALKPGMWDPFAPIGVDAKITLDPDQVKILKEFGGWWEPVAGRTRRGGSLESPLDLPSGPTAQSAASPATTTPMKAKPQKKATPQSAPRPTRPGTTQDSKNSVTAASTATTRRNSLATTSTTADSDKHMTRSAIASAEKAKTTKHVTQSPSSSSTPSKPSSTSANGSNPKAKATSASSSASETTSKSATSNKSRAGPSSPPTKGSKSGNTNKNTTPTTSATVGDGANGIKKRKRALSTGDIDSGGLGPDGGAHITGKNGAANGVANGAVKESRKQKKLKEGATPQILMSLQDASSAPAVVEPPLVVPSLGSQAELLEWRDSDCMEARYYEYCRVWYSQPAPTDAWKPNGGDHYANREQTYGEVTPEGMMCFFAELGLGANDGFLDIGSGLGNMTLYASFVRGARKSYGIEIQRNRHDVAEEIADDLALLQKPYWKREASEFIFTTESNLADCPGIRNILSDVSVIFCNNILFTPTTMAQVTDALVDLITDRTAVLVFTNDPWPRRSTIRPAPLRFWKSIEVNDACSWCSKNLKFYFYTFHEFPREAVPHYVYDAKSITAPIYVEESTTPIPKSISYSAPPAGGKSATAEAATNGNDKNQEKSSSNLSDAIDALADVAEADVRRAKKETERAKRRKIAAQLFGRPSPPPVPSDSVSSSLPSSKPRPSSSSSSSSATSLVSESSMEVDAASTTSSTSTTTTATATTTTTTTPAVPDETSSAGESNKMDISASSSATSASTSAEAAASSRTTAATTAVTKNLEPTLSLEDVVFLAPKTAPGELTHDQMIYIGFDAAARGAQRKPARAYVVTVAATPRPQTRSRK